MAASTDLLGAAIGLLEGNLTLIKVSTGLIFFLGLRVVYNLYFHPLSSYRGPWYLCASDIPLAFLQLSGKPHYTLKKAHDQYGNVIRIAPNTLSYIEPSAWNDIYGYRNGVVALPKDPLFYNEMLLPKETISIANDKDVKPIRRAVNAAFSPKALSEQEPMLKTHVGRLIGQLAKTSQQHGIVNVHKWVNFSFFDILSDFAFGENLGCVRDGHLHEWAQFVVDYFYVATLLHQCHKFWPLNKVLVLLIPPSVRYRKKRHSEVSLERVRRRIHASPDRPDFMFCFLQQAEKEELTKSVIEAQASSIILAGSETSAVALTAAIYYVVANDDVYRRLCEEVQGTFTSSADLKLRDVLSRLPYLEACVKETLRIRAPIANGFTRVVSSREGAMISGGWVPPDTVVTINHHCANLSEKNFRNPEEFRPERWLDDPFYKNDRRSVVQPFSVGPRGCPGKRFALYNIQLALAHLIWNFDMRLPPGAKSWADDQKVYNDWQQPALMVSLKERH